MLLIVANLVVSFVRDAEDRDHSIAKDFLQLSLSDSLDVVVPSGHEDPIQSRTISTRNIQT